MDWAQVTQHFNTWWVPENRPMRSVAGLQSRYYRIIADSITSRRRGSVNASGSGSPDSDDDEAEFRAYIEKMKEQRSKPKEKGSKTRKGEEKYGRPEFGILKRRPELNNKYWWMGKGVWDDLPPKDKLLESPERRKKMFGLRSEHEEVQISAYNNAVKEQTESSASFDQESSDAECSTTSSMSPLRG